jgi:NADH-quinone oxidoreductase subunit M
VSLIFFILGLPLIGAVIYPWLNSPRMAKTCAFLLSLGGGLAGILLATGWFPEWQAEIRYSWLRSFDVFFHFRADGLSLPYLVLVSVAFPVILSDPSKTHWRLAGRTSLVLYSQALVSGVLMAQDFFLVLFLWTQIAVLLFFLQGLSAQVQGVQSVGDKFWTPSRGALRLGIVGFLSVVPLMVACLMIYHAQTPHSFSFLEVQRAAIQGGTVDTFFGPAKIGEVVFGLVLLSFTLRMGTLPFQYAWSEFAEETDAETYGLAHLLTFPIGFFLLIKICLHFVPQVFRDSHLLFFILGILNLLYGFMVSLSEYRGKMILRHVAIFYVGLSFLGLGSTTVAGVLSGLFHPIAFTLGSLIFIWVLSRLRLPLDSIESSDLDSSEVLVVSRPRVAAVAAVGMVSWAFIPGTIGFVGIQLTVLGVNEYYSWVIAILGLGVVGVFATLLQTYRKLFFVPRSLIPMDGADRILWVFPVILVILLMGFSPNFSIESFTSHLREISFLEGP